MRIFLILLLIAPLLGFSQKKKAKKKSKYEAYWEMEKKKEAYSKVFKEGDNLFAQEKYFEAIEKFQLLFKDFPNDQQATARIKDIEIILASFKEEAPAEEIKRTFIPIEKMKLKQEVEIKTALNSDIKGNELKENYIEPKVEKPEIKKEITEKTEPKATAKPPQPVKEKATQDFRTELGKNYENGFTEDVYTKANRTITKRVIVKNGLGDEYMQVKHQWGGLFYFKNGEPITKFIWEKETEVNRP